MNIVFKKVIINNFMSFGRAEVVLDDMGFVLVSGRNNNKLDNAASNGSGKSSMINAICYALTGETTNGISNNIENIYTNPDDCWVELMFYVDNDLFDIKRIKTPRQDLKILVNGVDRSGKGIQESRKLLSQYLPDINSQLISSIIILGQGLPHRFTNNKPSHRKELLENLTKSDFMIQSIRDKLDLRMNELKTSQRQIQDKQIVNKTKLDMYNNQIKSLEGKIKEINDYNSEYSLESRLEYLDNKSLTTKADISRHKLVIEECRDDITESTNNKANIIKESYDIKSNLTRDLVNEQNQYNNKLIEAKTNKKMLENEIKKLKSISDVCPTCGQKIPNIEVVDTKPLENDLISISSEIDNLNSLYSDTKNKINSITSKCDLELSNKIKDLDENINKLNIDLKKYESELNDLVAKESRTQDEISKVNSMKNNLNGYLLDIKNINLLIDEINKDDSNLVIEMADVSARIVTVQNLVTLAKREFRGILLQHVIDYINKKVKQYSRDVFGNDLLSFTLNENYIDITFDKKPYENLSGGEKQKVDIIVQLALRELLSNQLNIRSNILAIDEVFDNLDTIGCSKIVGLINNLSDVGSVFIITHHKETLEISYDVELVVNKDNNGVSSVNFV